MFSIIYNTIFYEPLYNILIFLINILPFHSLGLAIILLTIIVRLIIFPFSHKSVITQKKIKVIEPEINKIKEKYKNKKEEQTRQIMSLYKEHGISPFSGFLMILIQLPIFIALFVILKDISNLNEDIVYSFLLIPENINTLFLGFIEISKSNLFISILAGVSQFFQIKLAMPITPKQSKNPSLSTEFQRSMSIQMKYIMPFFIVFISQKFPSGLALYWTTSNIFAIFHEIAVSRKSNKIIQKNDPVKESKDSHEVKNQHGRENKSN